MDSERLNKSYIVQNGKNKKHTICQSMITNNIIYPKTIKFKQDLIGLEIFSSNLGIISRYYTRYIADEYISVDKLKIVFKDNSRFMWKYIDIYDIKITI